MRPWIDGLFGNPSGSHATARAARMAVDEAREKVAAALGCEPRHVVFCGGGTESDNTAVVGGHRQDAPHLVETGTAVCSAVEHHAVLDNVERLGGRVVAVDGSGRVDPDALAAALDDQVRVVSVMLVNNEVGTVNELDAVADLVRERAPHAVIHTDAVQAFCWLDVAEAAAPADLVTITGHKFGGPQGAGVLVVRDAAAVRPLLVGGGHEHGRRSGTHNVAGIVGLGAAVEACAAQRMVEVERIGRLRDRLVDGLLAAIPGSVEVADRERRVAGNAHICLPGVESEALLFLLDQAGIAASAASACSSGALEPSHVLAAMGVPSDVAAGALRLSLGHTTTDADVDHALAVIPDAVARLGGVPASNRATA